MRRKVVYDLASGGTCKIIISRQFFHSSKSLIYLNIKTDRNPLSLKVDNSRSYIVKAWRQNDVRLNTVVMEVGLAKESIKSVQSCIGLLLSGNKPFIKRINPYNISRVCIIYPCDECSVKGDEHLSRLIFKMWVSCRSHNNTTRNVLGDWIFSMNFVDGVPFELALLNA